jgi:hypothetical protein
VRAPRNSSSVGRGKGTSPSGFPLRLNLAVILAISTLAFNGCGIENGVTYYSPPDFAYAGNLITLRHNSDNSDSSFLGYDIYYRAYYTLAEANTARSSIESATNSTASTPESVLSLLSSSGFRKINLASAPTVTQTPLLKEGPSTYYFSLSNDSPTTNWYYSTNEAPATHIQIVRGTGYGESFNEPYLVGDIDYGSTENGIGSGVAVYIDAFAVAYGYNFSSLASIYSFPASLYQPIGGSNGYALP